MRHHSKLEKLVGEQAFLSYSEIPTLRPFCLVLPGLGGVGSAGWVLGWVASEALLGGSGDRGALSCHFGTLLETDSTAAPIVDFGN